MQLNAISFKTESYSNSKEHLHSLLVSSVETYAHALCQTSTCSWIIAQDTNVQTGGNFWQFLLCSEVAHRPGSFPLAFLSLFPLFKQCDR